MSEFWEKAFQEKGVMWGEAPIALANEMAEVFAQQGYQTLLVPGFGYGRNAMPFYAKGFTVTGIEISATAIAYARTLLGEGIQVFHGSVDAMPFSEDVYDGIFCHALIHLLNADQRAKLLTDCYAHPREGGMMVFTAITKDAGTYGVGEQLGTDWYRTKDGVNLYFYDKDSIQADFEAFGLVEAEKIEEGGNGRPSMKFWKIVCRKAGKG